MLSRSEDNGCVQSGLMVALTIALASLAPTRTAKAICCLPNNDCTTTLSEDECEHRGGVFKASESNCATGCSDSNSEGGNNGDNSGEESAPTGGCCRSDCELLTRAACEAISGEYLGDGVPCPGGLDPCGDHILEACCLPSDTGAFCDDIPPAECLAMGGTVISNSCENVACFDTGSGPVGLEGTCCGECGAPVTGSLVSMIGCLIARESLFRKFRRRRRRA